ncbi:MAG: hypothetical protein JWO78_1829 [Micavibrio sp.]|nr:hypothetical protein [Micavibrio sp.]
MIGVLRKILKKQSPSLNTRPARDPARYELEKTASRSLNVAERMKIAKNPKTHQEILYFMAENDPDENVRRAVAKNLATPILACGVIAQDKNVDVRLALAERLVYMLPELSQEDHSQLYAVAVKALATLAMDEVLRVRVALSSALKDHAYAPVPVVSQLAKDVEREVSEPILRFCMALPDDVLIGILQNMPPSWAVDAIARRKYVSDNVSAAVIDTGSKSGGAALLKNGNAKISQKLLKDIVARARELPEWQEPLAMRKGLPPDIAKILSEFAHDSVRKILIRRGDFDRRTRDDISQAMKRRLIHSIASDTAKDNGGETPQQRAVDLMKKGKLDESIIADSIALREEEFVLAALAILARTTPAEVKRVMALNTAKPIVALTWKAGLSMRLALQLQQSLGRVPPRELLYPRNGSDYPMNEQELRWQIDFLGLAAG